MRQGSVYIIRTNNLKIVSLSLRKSVKIGCHLWHDPGSPRVKSGQKWPKTKFAIFSAGHDIETTNWLSFLMYFESFDH